MESIRSERKVESGSRLDALDRKGIIGALRVVAQFVHPEGFLRRAADEARESLESNNISTAWARAWLGELAWRVGDIRGNRKLPPISAIADLEKTPNEHISLLPGPMIGYAPPGERGRAVSYDDACALMGQIACTVWLCCGRGTGPIASTLESTARRLAEVYPDKTPRAGEVRA